MCACLVQVAALSPLPKLLNVLTLVSPLCSCSRSNNQPTFFHNLTISSVSPFIECIHLILCREQSTTATSTTNNIITYYLLHSCGAGKSLSLSLLCAPVRVPRLFGRPPPPLTSAGAAKLHICSAVRKADPLRLLIPRHCCLSHTTAQQSQPVFLRLWTSISSSRFSIHTQNCGCFTTRPL